MIQGMKINIDPVNSKKGPKNIALMNSANRNATDPTAMDAIANRITGTLTPIKNSTPAVTARNRKLKVTIEIKANNAGIR